MGDVILIGNSTLLLLYNAIYCRSVCALLLTIGKIFKGIYCMVGRHVDVWSLLGNLLQSMLSINGKGRSGGIMWPQNSDERAPKRDSSRQWTQSESTNVHNGHQKNAYNKTITSHGRHPKCPFRWPSLSQSHCNQNNVQ